MNEQEELGDLEIHLSKRFQFTSRLEKTFGNEGQTIVSELELADFDEQQQNEEVDNESGESQSERGQAIIA